MTAKSTILVVEDNPTTRKMLRLVLTTEGYDVVEAGTGQAALGAVEKALPDLVLLDVLLPDMDGFQVLLYLRRLRGGAELPILALSGFLRPPEAPSDAADFTAWLVKPIEPSGLIDAVRAYLPQHKTRDASLGGGRRLLVVDDDPVQLKLTRIHFSDLGFDVTGANGAVEALAAARANRPDIVLSDVFMPGIDGFQLCFECRHDPHLGTVPVVLLSGQYGSTADQHLAQRVGASALVLRTPDFGHATLAIMDALKTPPPSQTERPNDQLAMTHARRAIHQLENQTAGLAGLAQRCGVLAAQLTVLSGIVDAVTRKADIEVALRDVFAAALDAAGISKGALILRDAFGALMLHQDVGFSEAERRKLWNFFGHADLLEDIITNGVSVLVPSRAVSDSASLDILAGAHIASVQIVPLIADGRGVGVMIIGATLADLTSEDSLAFAQAIGSQIVRSLELARTVGLLTDGEQRSLASPNVKS